MGVDRYSVWVVGCEWWVDTVGRYEWVKLPVGGCEHNSCV